MSTCLCACSVNVRASSHTALSEPALQLSHCKNEECPLGSKARRQEEKTGEERLIKINLKMSGSYAHRLLGGTIKWVDQIHGVRGENEEVSIK